MGREDAATPTAIHQLWLERAPQKNNQQSKSAAPETLLQNNLNTDLTQKAYTLRQELLIESNRRNNCASSIGGFLHGRSLP